MPTYEYKCLKCKKTFDHFQKMTDAPLKRCIHCKGKVERLIGAGAGLIFKGTGFYVTDYKKSTIGPKDKKESPAKTCDTKPPCGGKSCEKSE